MTKKAAKEGLNKPLQFKSKKVAYKPWNLRSTTQLDVVCFDYSIGSDLTQFNEVYVWDLDKTYLDTKIDSFKGLMRAIFEKSQTKKNIPGANELIKSIARYRSKHLSETIFPLFFVSASPPQMENKIKEKFSLDGLNPLMMFYKDNLKNIAPKRFSFLKKQIGYKVHALMQLRLLLNPDVKMLCFGDDSESDAIIYTLFSDICARRHTPGDLVNLLDELDINQQQADEIIRLQSLIEVQDPVEKVFINLATDTDPQYYLKFGRRCLATYDSFQIALDLVQDQRLSLEELGQVIDEMKIKFQFTNDQLVWSFTDLVKRRVLGLSSFEMIKNYLIEKKIMSQNWKSPAEPFREKRVIAGKVYDLDGYSEPWIRSDVDYINDY